MAKLIAGSQSSFLLPQLHPHATCTRGLSVVHCGGFNVSFSYKSVATSRSKSLQNHITSSTLSHHYNLSPKGLVAAPVSRASSIDVPGETIDLKPEVAGGGGDEGSGGGKDRRGGGGGGGGDDNGGSDKGNSEGSDEGGDAKRNKALSMSQKITLGYAALVGLGGFMGYLKSGSQKSLASGGLSALLLYYVYTELPKRPVFASAVGLGLSAALLVVMGSRFKRSGKVFPAGVVSLVSLIMTGGYVHGIMKAH